jgi:hypothetical protein
MLPLKGHNYGVKIAGALDQKVSYFQRNRGQILAAALLRNSNI